MVEQESFLLEFKEYRYSLEGGKRTFSTYVFNRTLTGGSYYLNNRKAILVTHENNQL